MSRYEEFEIELERGVDFGAAVEPAPGPPRRPRVEPEALLRKVMRPWPRTVLVAVTVVVTALSTAVLMSVAEGSDMRAVFVPGPVVEDDSEPRPDLLAEARALLPAGGLVTVPIHGAGAVEYDKMAPGDYALDVACGFDESGESVDMVVTVLSDGSETLLTVTEKEASRVDITVGDGGFRLDPLRKNAVVCMFSLSAN